MLLRDTLGNDDVTLVKFANLGGEVAVNVFDGTREIHVVDFDEQSQHAVGQVNELVVRAFGNSFDTPEELAAIGEAGSWESFLELSSWTDVNPEDSSYSQSFDGLWWYDFLTEFVDYKSETNPHEEFAGVFQVAVLDESVGHFARPKKDWMVALLGRL